MDPQRVVIDTERVIAEVRTRPQIWQPQHLQYKSRDARQHAWSQITRVLVPEIGELSRADQNEIEKKVQQRWRTARDSFVKARGPPLEGGGSVGRERTYGYYEAMRFLEPTLRPPQRARAPSPPRPAPAAPRRRRRLRLRALPERRHTPLDEDDDNFFKSLAPMLRELRTEQKLSFRSRVLALALQTQAAPAHYLADSHYHCDDRELEAAPDDDVLETKYRPPSADAAPLARLDPHHM